MWHVTNSPAARAACATGTYSSGSENAPNPAFASHTPCARSSSKSARVSPGSRITEPACTVTPPGRKSAKQRCAAIASAFTPAGSDGRPGTCTSLAEIARVIPPCR